MSLINEIKKDSIYCVVILGQSLKFYISCITYYFIPNAVPDNVSPICGDTTYGKDVATFCIPTIFCMPSSDELIH